MNDRSNGNVLHYVSKALERPLMIMPEKMAVILSVLEGRLGLDASGLQSLVDEKLLAYVNKPQADRFTGDVQTTEGEKLRRSYVKPYKVADGTAIISIVGSLVNRGAWIGSYSGMTSYEGIRHQLASAGRDQSIHSILLDIDSPGGEAVGAFEVGEDVRKLNAIKPVAAFVNGLCCSAAYAIASQAGRVEASTTSILGSIGVVMMHVDQSQRLHNMGVKPTFIHAGKNKVDGNSFEPLSADVKARLQADVDKLYDMFVAHVAAGGRKGLSAKAIRAQEASTFIGSDAVDQKLADAIGTFQATLSGIQRRSKTTRTMKMDDDTPIYSATQHTNLLNAAVAAARLEASSQITQSLTAEHTTAMAAAVATARTEGANAERERFTAILALPEAQGRTEAALHMATTTTMSADQIKPVLAGLPVGGKPAATVPANGLGLVVDKPQTAEAAANSWDKSLAKHGAKFA
jgi:signal peptide peptidase SppA